MYPCQLILLSRHMQTHICYMNLSCSLSDTHFLCVFCHFHSCMCLQFPYCQRKAWGTCCILSSASEWWEAESLLPSLLRWTSSPLTTWEEREWKKEKVKERERKRRERSGLFFASSPVASLPGSFLLASTSLFSASVGCRLTFTANLTNTCWVVEKTGD